MKYNATLAVDAPCYWRVAIEADSPQQALKKAVTLLEHGGDDQPFEPDFTTVDHLRIVEVCNPETEAIEYEGLDLDEAKEIIDRKDKS